MKNATLVINNSKKFSDDIWQYENNFSETKWNVAKQSWIEILETLYRIIDTESFSDFMELFTKSREDLCFGDAELYQLGDIINMLSSIDIKVKGE